MRLKSSTTGAYFCRKSLDGLGSCLVLSFLLTTAFSPHLLGQTFVELANPFPGLFRGFAAWGDYDNDGLLDLAICGSGQTNLLTRIYHNDGGGLFHDIEAGLPGISGAVAWGDYDNDGDLDL